MLVNHIVAIASDQAWKAMSPGCLYEYVVGINGVFVRAKRKELEACIPVVVAGASGAIRGLELIITKVQLSSLVPAWLLGRMFEMAYRAGDKEILFYLQANPWRLVVPEQEQHAGSVRPLDPFSGGADTVIEVHSHHHMPAFFSGTDNLEESAGFRIYVVLGNLGERPTVRARVGIYGHFWEIPLSWIFDLPDAIRNNFEGEEADYVEIDID